MHFLITIVHCIGIGAFVGEIVKATAWLQEGFSYVNKTSRYRYRKVRTRDVLFIKMIVYCFGIGAFVCQIVKATA